MWDFLWHMRGATPLPETASDEEILDRLERMLDRQRKPITIRDSDGLVFDDPLFDNPFGPNWLAMVIYDHGHLWIAQGAQGRILKYELRSLHGFIWCLFCAVSMGLFFLANGELFLAAKYAVIAFAWLYGMNILTAWGRVPRKIRDAVNGV